jgi:outer membrane protein OmpA-like peptidoglycan-associated protein
MLCFHFSDFAIRARTLELLFESRIKCFLPGFWFILILINTYELEAQPIRVCYVPDNRAIFQDRGYAFDGRLMRNSVAPKILNARYFGSNGVVPCGLELIPLTENPINKAAIRAHDCSVIFLGLFYDPVVQNVITLTEIQAVRDWSMAKTENVVIVPELHATSWYYEHLTSSIRRNVPTPNGLAGKIFNGPFGRISDFNQGGHSVGYFKGGNGMALASDTEGRPTIFLDITTNDIMLADVDLLTSLGGISDGKSLTNKADSLMANFWAYVCELAKKPVPEPLKGNEKSVLNFERSSDELTASAIVRLNSIVLELKRHPDLKAEERGYTDIIGDPRANLALSERRARNVRRYMVTKGVKRRRISLKALGEAHAVYAGTDDARKAENMRVEVEVMKQ